MMARLCASVNKYAAEDVSRVPGWQLEINKPLLASQGQGVCIIDMVGHTMEPINCKCDSPLH